MKKKTVLCVLFWINKIKILFCIHLKKREKKEEKRKRIKQVRLVHLNMLNLIALKKSCMCIWIYIFSIHVTIIMSSVSYKHFYNHIPFTSNSTKFVQIPINNRHRFKKYILGEKMKLHLYMRMPMTMSKEMKRIKINCDNTCLQILFVSTNTR